MTGKIASSTPRTALYAPARPPGNPELERRGRSAKLSHNNPEEP